MPQKAQSFFLRSTGLGIPRVPQLRPRVLLPHRNRRSRAVPSLPRGGRSLPVRTVPEELVHVQRRHADLHAAGKDRESGRGFQGDARGGGDGRGADVQRADRLLL